MKYAHFFTLALLLGVFTLSLSLSAGAQYYIKKNKSGEIELNDQNAPPDVEKAPALKTQTDFANQIYKNCMAQENPSLQGENKDMFCGCTSAKSMEVMTPQQMAEIANNTSEGQIQRNRMLMFVYAPCIEYPTTALIMNNCMKNAAQLRNPQKTCPCLAKMMSDFIKVEAPSVIEFALRMNPKDMDPMRMLLESSQYQGQEKYATKTCMGKYEYQ